jgi:hypothetical protein
MCSHPFFLLKNNLLNTLMGDFIQVNDALLLVASVVFMWPPPIGKLYFVRSPISFISQRVKYIVRHS